MDDIFDVVVLGTGLSESIAAAALAKAGLRVAHIDPRPYYGASEATLTLDELVQWAESVTTDKSGPVHHRIDYLSPDRPSQQKQYSISLSPSVIPSVGPFISSVVSSGVARYGSYKLLGPVAIYRNGKLQSVPQNKETIFQDRTISLIEKRRLMRFIAFASGEFEESPEFRGKEDTYFDHFLRDSFGLSEEICRVIMFSLAFCNFSSESTSSALHRLRCCLRSVGRYGPSPFLIGYYGGSGEIAQGFCRTAAVNGGLYVLGRNISNLVVHGAKEPHRFSVELEGIPDLLRSQCILSSVTYLPRYLRPQINPVTPNFGTLGATRIRAMARCIAIVNGSIDPPCVHGTDNILPADGNSDSFLVVFPPGSLDRGSHTSSVTLLTSGAGTMSAPSGKNIVYLSMPLEDHDKSSKELLLPYLEVILDANPACQSIFQLFYMQYFSFTSDQPADDITPNLFILPHLDPHIFQNVDQAARDAENAFWLITQVVGPQGIADRQKGFWTDNITDNSEGL